MQLDNQIPDPWPEEIYWFDLYVSHPILVRYSNFYNDDFSNRVGCLHLWYHGKHHSKETNSSAYLSDLEALLNCVINQDKIVR